MMRFLPLRATRLTAASVTAISVTIGAALAQTPIERRNNRFSPEQDVQLGRQAAGEIRQQMPMLDDERIDGFIEDVGDRLIAEIPDDFRQPAFRYSFDVVNLREINAFALPGGPMFVHRGMIEAARTEGEIAGVMAHELAHVKNRDTLTMTVTATVAGAIAALANFALFFGGGDDRERPGGLIGALALMILAPMAAGLVQMAISRTREYEADRVGAEIAGDPASLASALQKIEGWSKRIVNVTAERNPASGQLFIINPLAGRGADNLFSTHPNTGNRVKALMELGTKMGLASRRPTLVDAPVSTSVPNTPARTPGPWG